MPSEKPQITCRRFVKSFSAWHDGELAEGARASFETHRAECTRCARYASGFKAAITITKNALTSSGCSGPFPEDLTQAILEHVGSETSVSTRIETFRISIGGASQMSSLQGVNSGCGLPPDPRSRKFMYATETFYE